MGLAAFYTCVLCFNMPLTGSEIAHHVTYITPCPDLASLKHRQSGKARLRTDSFHSVARWFYPIVMIPPSRDTTYNNLRNIKPLAQTWDIFQLLCQPSICWNVRLQKLQRRCLRLVIVCSQVSTSHSCNEQPSQIHSYLALRQVSLGLIEPLSGLRRGVQTLTLDGYLQYHNLVWGLHIQEPTRTSLREPGASPALYR